MSVVLTLYALMDSYFWFDEITWDGPLHISSGVRLYLKDVDFFLSEDLLYFKSVDPNEMPH